MSTVEGMYPATESYRVGKLDVGDGQRIHWELAGNPDGKPAVVLHGGPGSGCTPGYRRMFDPAAYKMVLFDQRNCGSSMPHASDPATDLSTNTTAHLVADIELLREHLGIDRWLVLGASWGATLAFVYAEAFPERVTELVLGAVTAGRQSELDWMIRTGAPNFFPEAYEKFLALVPPAERDGNLPLAYHRMMSDPHPDVRQRAADGWLGWEMTYLEMTPTPVFDGRYADPVFRYTFARIITHYFGNGCFLEPNQVLRDMARIADIPGTMIHGRMDLGGPLATAWAVHRAWPRAELIVIDEPGHAPGDMGIELARATDKYAAAR